MFGNGEIYDNIKFNMEEHLMKEHPPTETFERSWARQYCMQLGLLARCNFYGKFYNAIYKMKLMEKLIEIYGNLTKQHVGNISH